VSGSSQQKSQEETVPGVIQSETIQFQPQSSKVGLSPSFLVKYQQPRNSTNMSHCYVEGDTVMRSLGMHRQVARSPAARQRVGGEGNNVPFSGGT
jgi:hypothetical protein